MSNYKLLSLLAATPLDEEMRHNIITIFSALDERRQLDILSNWQKYLDKILFVHEKADAERKRTIEETFQSINAMIDEAYIRDQQEKEKKIQENAQKEADIRAAHEYDQRRREAELEKIRTEQDEARKRLADPLAFL